MGIRELQADARMRSRHALDLSGCNAFERGRRLMSESEWLVVVEQAARAHGWVWHNDLTPFGHFPNLMLGRDNEVLFVLLLPEIGRVSGEQQCWMDRLRHRGCEVHVWQPSGEEAMQERLSRSAS